MRKDRIEERLRALNTNQFDAAKKAGKNAHFIYDFLIGRKKSFKGDGPIRLAQALECSVEYLTGESDTPGDPPASGAIGPPETRKNGLRFAGIVEAGSFRKIGSMRFPDTPVPLSPHPDYPLEDQSAYLVRGDGLTARGISEGMFLTVIGVKAAQSDIKNGSIVVIEHTRLGGTEIEVSARELQYFPGKTEFRALPATGEIEPIVMTNGKTSEPDGKVRLVGLVVSATMVF